MREWEVSTLGWHFVHTPRSVHPWRFLSIYPSIDQSIGEEADFVFGFWSEPTRYWVSKMGDKGWHAWSTEQGIGGGKIEEGGKKCRALRAVVVYILSVDGWMKL